MASSELLRVRRRSQSKKDVNKAYENALRNYIVHYSCESFYDNASGQSRRVTSIAVRNLDSAQTQSWSLHSSAELLGLQDQIPDNLDIIEKHLLSEYFTFLQNHADSTFIHWNMRDKAYGFPALEHRYKVLGGQPFILQDDRKLDLARVLINLYGPGYAPHTCPKTGKRGRVMSLMEMNRITSRDALQGKEEADAFENGEFLKLDRSTLAKVDVFHNFFDRLHANKLKTNATFSDKYGFKLAAIPELARDNPFIIAFVVGGGVIAALVKWWDALKLIF
ncbi:TPA: hypothetical protein ACG0A1_004429 [Enterobacter ludwigii]